MHNCTLIKLILSHFRGDATVGLGGRQLSPLGTGHPGSRAATWPAAAVPQPGATQGRAEGTGNGLCPPLGAAGGEAAFPELYGNAAWLSGLPHPPLTRPSQPPVGCLGPAPPCRAPRSSGGDPRPSTPHLPTGACCTHPPAQGSPQARGASRDTVTVPPPWTAWAAMGDNGSQPQAMQAGVRHARLPAPCGAVGLVLFSFLGLHHSNVPTG